MIRYAGYDTTEWPIGWDNSHRSKHHRRMFAKARAARFKIDVAYARRLRRRGFLYRQIGEMVAKKQGRKIRYTACAVKQALDRKK